MADICDDADVLLETELRFALQARKRHVLPHTGTCHYCEEEVGPGQLFCGKDCAEDFERLQQAHARAGRPHTSSLMPRR